MQSPERIDKLVAGMPPESEHEARLEGIVRELRASAPAAPPVVRERVRTLREPERRRFAWRPALVALPLAAALVAGAVGLSRSGTTDGGAEATSGASAPASGAERGATVEALRPERGTHREAFSAQKDTDAQRLSQPPVWGGAALAPAAAGRAQEWDVTLELRVPHNDRLSDASADAIRTTRALAGYVVSSSIATRQEFGEARLVLRVPSRRMQDALARLSQLGTITGQQLAVRIAKQSSTGSRGESTRCASRSRSSTSGCGRSR